MITSDVNITEIAVNTTASSIQIGANLTSNFAANETVIESSVVAAATTAAAAVSDKLDVKNHFARLKRRMRGRSSSIL